MKIKLIISTSCFSLTLRVLNTEQPTRLTASVDTDPPSGVPGIHGHQWSSIRAVKYHISVYRTKSQILCVCKQKVRCHVPVNKQSDIMYLWTKSQMSCTCEQTVRCHVPVNKQSGSMHLWTKSQISCIQESKIACNLKVRKYVPETRQNKLSYLFNKKIG